MRIDLGMVVAFSQLVRGLEARRVCLKYSIWAGAGCTAVELQAHR